MSKSSLPPLWRHKRFLRLWLAMLVSTSGAYLLLVALSASVFERHHSAALSAVVFASHWVLPIALAPLLTYLNQHFPPARLLRGAEILSAVVSALIAIAASRHLGWTLTLLSARGFFEAVTKTARSVALKHYVEDSLLAHATGIFNTSFLLGTGLGALLGSMLIGNLSIQGIVVINVACFLFAAFCYSQLPSVPSSIKLRGSWNEAGMSLVSGWRAWANGWREVIAHRLVKPSLVLFTTVGVFQSFHNVARTALPMGVLNGTAIDVTYFQIINCLGLIAGAWAVSAKLARRTDVLGSEVFWLGATSCSVIIPVVAPTVVGALAAYFVFAFAFEVTFTLAQTRVMTNCPKTSMPVVASFQHPPLLASMVLGVLGFGRLADRFSLLGAALAAATFGLTAAVTVALTSHINLKSWRTTPRKAA